MTGTPALHAELEQELADWLGQESALVLSTGYHANLAVVTALADRTVRVISDAHIHACWWTPCGCRGPGSPSSPYSDVAAVEAGLVAAQQDGERALVLVESGYTRCSATRPRWPSWPPSARAVRRPCWSSTRRTVSASTAPAWWRARSPACPTWW